MALKIELIPSGDALGAEIRGIDLSQTMDTDTFAFVENAFNVLGLKFEKYLKINKKFYRPSEVDLLIADSSKIRNELGWKAKTKINKLIEKILINDFNLIKNKT